MFAPFRRPGNGNLALPEFSRRCTLAASSGSSTPAQFGDRFPAIVSRAVGGGKVVLINSSADTAWTDWPKHKTYVPWLHGLCFSLATRAGAIQIRTSPHWLAGEEPDSFHDSTAYGQGLLFFRVGARQKSAHSAP